MRFNDFTIYGLVLIVATASGVLTACDRNTAPPLPLAAVASSPVNEAASAVAVVKPSPSAARAPYGASAPMAQSSTQGVDGSRTAQAEALPGTMRPSPEDQLNTAPTAAGSAPAAQVPLTPTELTFITQATEAGTFHLRASQLAADRATNSAVKSYAALLVTDQAQVNRSLQDLAKLIGVPIPASLSEPKQRVLDRLARASEAEFDSQFLAAAGSQDHLSVIELYERTGRETRDPRVRAFVLSTLPTLRAHLSAAERLPLHG